MDQAATRVPHWSQKRLPGGRVAAHSPQFRAPSAQPQVEQKTASCSGRGPQCGQALSDGTLCPDRPGPRRDDRLEVAGAGADILGPQRLQGLCRVLPLEHRVVLVGQLAGSLVELDLLERRERDALGRLLQVLRLVVHDSRHRLTRDERPQHDQQERNAHQRRGHRLQPDHFSISASSRSAAPSRHSSPLLRPEGPRQRLIRARGAATAARAGG